MAYCPRCGAELLPDARFCTSCRLELPTQATASSSPPTTPPPPPAPQPETSWQTTPAAPPPGPPPPGAGPPTRRSRTPLLIVAAVVVAAGAIGLVAFLLLRGSPEEAPADVAAPTQPPATSPTPAGVPGIDEPVSVEGLDVLVSSAELSDSYTSEAFGDTYHPNVPQDTLLIVSATADGTVEDVQDWKVDVTDDRGRRETPGVTSTTTEDDSAEIEWVFVVRENAGSFVLNLPGGVTVELESLISG